MHNLVLLVLGLTVLLALAVLLLPLSDRLRIPFTVLLAAAGIALGIGAEGLGDSVGGLWLLGDAVAAMEHLDITSDAVLFIFLPGLVFNSAMSIDVRRLFDNLAPILSLAVVGLLISTFAVGYALDQAAGVGLLGCLLLGAIVSATDPVAVVALFRELGAPKRLALLVEGESLFNDATAIVLFGILLAMLEGAEQVGILDGALEFLKVFLGGVATGAVLAWAALHVVSRLRIPFAQTSLTVSLAWLSFVIAEHELHVSGVMAVVAAGLVTGARGPTSMSGGTWRTLRVMWEQIDFWATSIIFVMVGMAAPAILSEAATEDLLLLALLVVIAFASRSAIVFGLLPRAASAPQKAIMIWGGLRGAVSLALALSVMENTALAPDLRDFVGIMVCGLVVFTLAVNATTIRPLMAALGLDRLSPDDAAIRRRTLALAFEHVDDEVRRIARDHAIDPALAPRLSRPAPAEPEGAVDWRSIGLAMLARHEHRIYLQRFEDGVVAPRIARMLMGHVGDLLDALKSGGPEAYEACDRRFLGFGWRFRLAQALQRRLGLSRPLAVELADRFQIMETMSQALDGLAETGLPAVAPVVGEEAHRELAALVARRSHAVERCLEAMEMQYPDYAAALKRRFLARMTHRLARRELAEAHAQGLIGGELLRDLDGTVEALRSASDRYPALDLGLEPERLVARVPFLAHLSADHIARIAGMLRPRLALPGETIIRTGDNDRAMYFISTGSVEVLAGDQRFLLGSGDFFGEIALLHDRPRTADVVAVGYCNLLVLDTAAFRSFLDAWPEARATMEAVAAERLDGLEANNVPE